MERWRHFARGRRCSTERSNPWRLTKLGENISKSIGNLPGRLSDFCFWLDLNVQLVLNAYIYNSCRSASTSWSNRACKRATDVSTGLVLIYPVNICQRSSGLARDPQPIAPSFPNVQHLRSMVSIDLPTAQPTPHL